MKTIGIKLADGSFYPVLEEDTPAEKVLELTTAHNNQTKIMVDLYRSKNCTMEDAEYVDSLQIENLNAHPNGEPTISFCVSIDEDNQLSARIKDPETGKESDTTITLVSRTIEERLVTDEYDISDSDIFNTAEQEEDNNGAGVAAAAAVAGVGLLGAAALMNNDDISDDETEADNEMVAAADTMDFEDSPSESTENDFDLGIPAEEPIEEPVIEDPIIEEPVDEPVIEDPIVEEPLSEEPIMEETSVEDVSLDEPEISDDLSIGDETLVTDSENDSDIVNFEDSIPEDTDDSETSETTTSEDFSLDIPEDFENDKATDDLASDDTFFNNTDAFGDPVEKDFSLPDFDNLDENNEEVEPETEPELPDDFFNDDTFNDTSLDNFDIDNLDDQDQEQTPASAGNLSFTGLYDKETEMGVSGSQDEDIKKKTKVPVIICIVCAIICIIATILILFVIPSKYNLINKAEKEVVVEKTEEIVEITPEPVPEAKEDEVIIVEKAEEVVPEQPEVVEEKLENISYKITWGDTLWDIADTYYKNPWRYKYIARYNGIKNPDHIVSGTYITIPAE